MTEQINKKEEETTFLGITVNDLKDNCALMLTRKCEGSNVKIWIGMRARSITS